MPANMREIEEDLDGVVQHNAELLCLLSHPVLNMFGDCAMFQTQL